MKLYYPFLVLLVFNCASDDIKQQHSLEDTSYEIKISPCVCKREEMIVHTKRIIIDQGLKDYEQLTARDVEPELESKIKEEEYDQFLYDFSLKDKQGSGKEDDFITAEGKVNQNELNEYVEKKSKSNRRNPITSSPAYGSKGLEVIKGFQSDRKKHQTVGEISKSKPIILYEIKRR